MSAAIFPVILALIVLICLLGHMSDQLTKIIEVLEKEKPPVPDLARDELLAIRKLMEKDRVI